MSINTILLKRTIWDHNWFTFQFRFTFASFPWRSFVSESSGTKLFVDNVDSVDFAELIESVIR